jgi:hypothetical protein
LCRSSENSALKWRIDTPQYITGRQTAAVARDTRVARVRRFAPHEAWLRSSSSFAICLALKKT